MGYGMSCFFCGGGHASHECPVVQEAFSNKEELDILKRKAADLDKRLVKAFLQGARWWEYHQTKATMWQSDQSLTVDEAERRLRDGSLGEPDKGEK